MLLYADEDFALPVVKIMQQLGYDVITVQADGRTSAPDPDVLARAASLGRVVLTYNRRDFERLDRQGAAHCGLVTVKRDKNYPALAARIDAALAGQSPGRWCIRVNRPHVP